MIYPGYWGGHYWQRHREIMALFGLKVITEPAGEQIDLPTAYAHLSLTPDGSPLSHPDDAWLSDVGIPAAREYCETDTERALATQTLEMALNGFPGGYGWAPAWFGQDMRLHHGIPLPMSPVQQVLSVTYLDGDGNSQTLDPATYTLDDWSAMNVVNLSFGSVWPVTQQVANAVKIRYIAGYALPNEMTGSPAEQVQPTLPKLIRAAMLVVLGNFYENREMTTDQKLEEVPLGVSALLQRYRLRLSMA